MDALEESADIDVGICLKSVKTGFRVGRHAEITARESSITDQMKTGVVWS